MKKPAPLPTFVNRSPRADQVRSCAHDSRPDRRSGHG